MMTVERLKTPVTEIEIAELSNAEGMLPAGKDIISRMSYELTVLRSSHASPAGSASCIWAREYDDEFYETSCGNAFQLNEGTPLENDMKFCPYCGKLIEES